MKTKKWNPYCIRHSSITSDSDYLPEYALKKKVRWSMNSKQGSRYIKRRMGNDLKQKILVQNGIISDQQIQKKPSVLNCPRCSLVNAADSKYCSKCSYPLIPSAFEEIKAAEDTKFRALEEKFNDMQLMLEKLITGLKHANQQQVNAITESLFSSGALKVVCKPGSLMFLLLGKPYQPCPKRVIRIGCIAISVIPNNEIRVLNIYYKYEDA